MEIGPKVPGGHAHLEQLVRERVPGEELTYGNVKSTLVERHGEEVFNRNKVSGRSESFMTHYGGFGIAPPPK